VSNCLFRMGGAAMLLSNKRRDRRRAKYDLLHTVRVHKVCARTRTHACTRTHARTCTHTHTHHTPHQHTHTHRVLMVLLHGPPHPSHVMPLLSLLC
jgi:hypothetical protein